MREINSYRSSLLIVIRFLARDNYWDKSQYPVQLIFVPIALALRIKDGASYKRFVDGDGEDILREFVLNTHSAASYADRLIENPSGLSREQIRKEEVEALASGYKNLFIPDSEAQKNRNLEDFHEAIALIGSYTTISAESDER